MDILSLRHENEFIPIVDGEQKYYGGDQAWFATSVRRLGGCGTVAAANLIAYNILYGNGNGERKRPKDIYEKEEFIRHMNEVYRFVKPLKVPFISENMLPFKGFDWVFGVWPVGRLIRGVVRYGKALKESYIPVRFNPKRELPEQFIAKALNEDRPVALLIGNARNLKLIQVQLPGGASYLQTDFALHWVIITAMSGKTGTSGIQIKVSTWGGSAWLELAECFRTGVLKSGMCFFI